LAEVEIGLEKLSWLAEEKTEIELEKHTWGDWAADESTNNESMAAIGLDGSRSVESSEIEIDARNEKTTKNKESKEWKKEIQTFFAINGQTSTSPAPQLGFKEELGYWFNDFASFFFSLSLVFSVLSF